MLSCYIETTGAVPGLLARQLGRVKAAAFAAIGKYWHENFRRKHFTEAGAAEYGYTPRRGEQAGLGGKFWQTYTGRKLRKHGHKMPLVWTGRSKMATEVQDVRSTRNGARVVLHAPALNFRNKHSNVNMRLEMTTISEAEARTLGEVFKESFEREVEKACDARLREVLTPR
jgi:hypothetical protein